MGNKCNTGSSAATIYVTCKVADGNGWTSTMQEYYPIQASFTDDRLPKNFPVHRRAAVLATKEKK